MYLELGPGDLKMEYQKKTRGNGVDHRGSISGITFYKFDAKTQNAIRAVGKGNYYSFGKKSHKAIYPPEG